MKIRLVYWLNLLALAATASSALADAKSNPYETIVERNPFGLKPPPPPPENVPPPPPPAPPTTVKLTGILRFSAVPKALLEITEPGGKTSKKPIMLEGERLDAIEVISIDIDNNIVKIKNGGLETNLTFEKIETAKAAPAAPAAPGFVPPGAPRAFPAPLGTPPGTPSPTLINPGATSGGAAAGSGRNAIVTMGGAGGAPGAPAYGATPASFGGTGAGYPGGTPTAPAYNSSYPGVSAAGAAAADATGLRQIPSRPIRTDIPSPTATAKPMTREETELLRALNQQHNDMISQQTGRSFPPLPPTRFSPPINQ